MSDHPESLYGVPSEKAQRNGGIMVGPKSDYSTDQKVSYVRRVQAAMEGGESAREAIERIAPVSFGVYYRWLKRPELQAALARCEGDHPAETSSAEHDGHTIVVGPVQVHYADTPETAKGGSFDYGEATTHLASAMQACEEADGAVTRCRHALAEAMLVQGDRRKELQEALVGIQEALAPLDEDAPTEA